MTRRQATLLRAFCAWTVFVWVVFVRNILKDDSHSTGFKVVHSVLAAVSVAFAVAGWIVVRRVRQRREAPPSLGTSATFGNLEASSPKV